MENQSARAHHKAHNDVCNSPRDHVQYHFGSLHDNPNLSRMEGASNEAVNKQPLVVASIHHTSSAPSFFFPFPFSTS